MGLLTLVTQALPGVGGAGMTGPEVVSLLCGLVILVVVPVFWRK
jgi:hypothetical protein